MAAIFTHQVFVGCLLEVWEQLHTIHMQQQNNVNTITVSPCARTPQKLTSIEAQAKFEGPIYGGRMVKW